MILGFATYLRSFILRSALVAGICLATVSAWPRWSGGQTRAEAAIQRIRMVRRAPSSARRVQVNLWCSRDVAPSDRIRLQINTQNAPNVHLVAAPVDGAAWIKQAFIQGGRHGAPKAIGAPVIEWNARIAAENQKPNPNGADTFNSRQINLPHLPPGVYVIHATSLTDSTFHKAAGAWSVVNVTHLSIVTKRSPKRLLVWVTDARTGALTQGADVSLFNKAGGLSGKGVTNDDGVALMPMRPGSDVLLVRRGSDLAGVPIAVGDPDGQLLAHFETDRPIYRPGQSVSLKVILRRTKGQGYTASADRSIVVQLRDPKDDLIDSKTLDTNAMGTLQTSFDVPSEGMLGPYSLVAADGKDRVYDSIEVAEYRKPEFQASITPVKKRYLAGDRVEFAVQATYYFGSPVPNAKVHYTVRSAANPYFTPSRGYGDGNLYARDAYRFNPFVAEDTVDTDKNGRATIVLNSQKMAPDVDYDVQATVTDGSRREVQADSEVPVFAAAKRVGIRTDVIVATLGSLIPVDLRLSDLDGRPVGGDVSLSVTRQDWDEEKGEYVLRELAKTSVSVSKSGSLRYSLPAREAGVLNVEAIVRDDAGRVSKAVLEVEVAGNFGKNTLVRQEPKVDIQLDRDEYSPGSTAQAYVTTNHPGPPVLLVQEGQDIYGYRVISKSLGGQMWRVTTNLSMCPNAVLTASEWVKGRLVAGSTELMLPDPSRKLSVSVQPDRMQYHPGDTATMVVNVRDDKGRPIQGEIALRVVDSSIYAVSPDNTADPYDTFWSPRENRVTVATSAPEELSGGAFQAVARLGGDMSGFPGRAVPVRSRFVDTALWAGTITTDASGEATLKFEVPGNLTSWRATAIGVTATTQVGTGETTVVANRPVLLRLATPRQMVVGDQLTLIGTVNNRTDHAHAFRVHLSAEGLSLPDSADRTIRIDAKSEGHVEWSLQPQTLPVSGVAILTGEVEATDAPAPDMGDALRVTAPIVPRGVQVSSRVGGVLGQSAQFSINLPDDRIEPATNLDVRIVGGLEDALRQATEEVMKGSRYGTPMAIDQISVGAATHDAANRDAFREAVAMLGRDQGAYGWSWWANASPDPSITASAVRAIFEAKAVGMPIYENLLASSRSGAEYLYDQINLWDWRAQLAASLTEAGSKRASAMVAEVLRRGQDLSPYANIRLAEALHRLGQEDEAQELMAKVLGLASVGPEMSYIPVVNGEGWTASSAETTAEALVALVHLDMAQSEQAKMARWLSDPIEGDWRSVHDQAAMVRALSAYVAKHPSATDIGPVTLTVNHAPVTIQKGVARVPRELLTSGANLVELGRTSPGEVFVDITSRVFVPHLDESTHGVRVLRRFEVQNAGGVWEELKRNVKAGEPVRITMVAWGDNVFDAIRVVDPIPAGFEFVSDESGNPGREEVRDGAVINFVANQGTPQTFRYYIRAESEGRLVGLPARVELLRRPGVNGQSTSVTLTVDK